MAIRLENKVGDTTISDYQASYSLNGQKQKETSTVEEETKTVTYTYDTLGRLTKEERSGENAITYTYDAHNNRAEMTVGNQKTAYKYNKNEELLRTNTLNTDTNINAVTLYKNDKNGNQLAVVNRQEADTKEYFDLDVSLGDNRLNENVVYHYNAENQLEEAITGKNKVQYEYDASGLRTKKTVNGKETIYVWDGDQIVLELNAKGKVKRRYIRGNDLIYTDEGEGTKKQYYVTDLHGNVVQLLDESGKVVKSYEYDAFGNEVDADKKDENPYRYCGEYYDKETESVYLRARYYQPGLGRFLTRDTYTGEEDEPLSLHLYTYCENDTVNAVDPSGHDSYVLYDKNAVAGDADYMFSDEARIVSKKWKNCSMIGVTNAKDFMRKWKKYLGKRIKNGKPTRKKVRIDNVYIISHGSIGGDKGTAVGEAVGYMMFNDKSKIVSRVSSSFRKDVGFNSANDIFASRLARKKIKNLTFSCCNTANPDCYSIADAFIRRMKITNEVIGFDGGAYFDYDDNTLKEGGGNQETWHKYVEYGYYDKGYIFATRYGMWEPERERMGKRIYKNGSWSPIKYNTDKKSNVI